MRRENWRRACSKERVIAPVLEPALGCQIELVDGFDTDQLGTFTRDIPRDGTQLEAARKKARIGMAGFWVVGAMTQQQVVLRSRSVRRHT